MGSLDRTLRRALENKVKQARRAAEAGARKALEQLAVHHHEPWPSMLPEQRQLRNRLRAHGRQLGDRRDTQQGTQSITRLAGECAYEHWHRMLFARFLAENDLLIEPGTGVAITIKECRELAREQGLDWMELASSYAVRMLPQIFRTDDPVLEVTLPPETRSELEDLLAKLPQEVFLADDSLGWVYQFWQAEQKDAVNRSGNKIGADELPAVTQLFTEDYMVEFLLHNTLGAWWAGKVLEANQELAMNAKGEDELRSACALGTVHWNYLRFVREGDSGPWRPASGTFEGWPKAAKDITVLDPCMGSGHFLVFALPLMTALRMEEEGLSETAAIEAVLRDNLFGLEIDQRCTQIAAFNLALAAWRRVGYRALPELHLACSGLAIGVSKAEWLKIAERADSSLNERIVKGLESLYSLFAKAPWLGSLINPHRKSGDLFIAGFKELEPLLTSLLASRQDVELTEMAVAVQGMAKSVEIMNKRFVLVATNVPYLGSLYQNDMIKEFCEKYHCAAKADLANCFSERCMEFCMPGGNVAIITPQSWLFQKGYEQYRKNLLEHYQWIFLARLGTKAFETISGERVNVCLIFMTNVKPELGKSFGGIDASAPRNIHGKAKLLIGSPVSLVDQSEQKDNPDSVITFEPILDRKLLSGYATINYGSKPGQTDRVVRLFWEINKIAKKWQFIESTPTTDSLFTGKQKICFSILEIERKEIKEFGIRSADVWGKNGIVISQMNEMPFAIYLGNIFDNNTSVIRPQKDEYLVSILVFLQSGEYLKEIRKINQKLDVAAHTMVKVAFDFDYWNRVAEEKYSHELPKPHSDSPTQWLFKGHPKCSEQPLQVAVARLLGYRWPRQTGSSFPDCPALGPDGLEPHADEDGIVCLPPLNREQPAARRLRALLAEAFGQQWSAAKERELLATTDSKSETLEDWLLDEFCEQHSSLFHHRPFVWHIWDGRRDGFNALVNYHKLAATNGEGRRLLEKLIYSSLGDWITQQKQEQQAGKEGADARVAAAKHLQKELIHILEGKPPYDIFVRWKPLHEQAIGWDPDINDGVRLNIRPFMTAKPLGARARNACILRTTPRNIRWSKDRGKEPQRPKEDYPWFWSWDEMSRDFAGGREFNGARWNDLHYTNDVKKAVRDSREGAEK